MHKKLLISVIVPSYNATKYTTDFFRAFRNQTLDRDFFEVIIVDNNSSDDTNKEIRRHQKEFKNLRVLSYSKAQSSYAARNHGATTAKGEILAFTDIDCQPQPSWLSDLAAQKSKLKTKTIIAGIVKFIPTNNLYNLYEIYDTCTFLKQESASKKNKGLTANLSISRENFVALKGFKSLISGGDSEFCTRAVANSYSIVLSESAIVLHPTRSTFQEISKKTRRVAKGIAQTTLLKRGTHPAKTIALQLVATLILWDLWKRFKDLPKVKETSKRGPLIYLVFCYYMGSYQRFNIIRYLLSKKNNPQ